ncbi:MAG TPA: M20/M25/M40 family metallo-hydrolase [Pseudonocardiaceae bacterium]
MAEVPEAGSTPDADVVALCAALIRFDTTNRGQGDCEGEREAAEFVAAHLTGSGLEPVLLESAPRRSNVVVRVPGADRSLPAVLVQGHLDVVPAVAEDWTVPPFAGEIRDGYLWGRGAVDMKDLCAGTLSVLRHWSRAGLRPRRDVVVAFVADEEDNGDYGADWLVQHHAGLFDGCAAAIGESGGFTFGGPDSPVRLYPVGTAERGTLHLRLSATGRAGHASRPNPSNAVVAIVRTLERIASHEWPVHLTPAVAAYLRGAADALGVAADLDDLSTVDELVAKLGRAGTLAAATVRISSTPTGLAAGGKVNVIPSTASALVDVRTLPGTADEVLSVIDSMLEPTVERHILARRDAVAAPMDTPWFHAMADALRAEDPEAVVLPYCLGGGTDAKAFSSLGIACYGFAPLRAPLDPTEYDYRAMAHGVDERIPLDGLRFGARVLDRFLRTV